MKPELVNAVLELISKSVPVRNVPFTADHFESNILYKNNQFQFLKVKFEIKQKIVCIPHTEDRHENVKQQNLYFLCKLSRKEKEIRKKF